MKSYLGFLLLIFSLSSSAQQNTYWQQEVNYKIEVSLDVKNKTLKGFEQIEYINHSPDTLTYIWFHVWPNAYKNKNTAYAQQFGSTFTRNNIGFIDKLQFRINDSNAVIEAHPEHIDILKIKLNNFLLPGDSIRIETPFFVQLPEYSSRLGYADEDFYISQWYPKPAVYDRKGWHPMAYLNRGEFYSEFGRYDVSITLPSTYVVAATGELATEKELNQYKIIGTKNMKGPGVKYKPAFDSTYKTLRYVQENIHDFAWFASEDFIIRYTQALLSNQHIVDVFTYAKEKGSSFWGNANDHIADVLFEMKSLVGEYPYNTISAVEGVFNRFSAGMEYPTICLLNTTDNYVLTHEIIHNWFYAVIGTNEREHAWMDEGFTDWYSHKLSPRELDEIENATAPIDQNAERYSDMRAYSLAVYLKASKWLTLLKVETGTENFNKGMKEYFRKWKFRHPYPEDFQQVMEQVSGKKLNKIFALLKERGKL
jgi:Peptidase family M1 domain